MIDEMIEFLMERPLVGTPEETRRPTRFEAQRIASAWMAWDDKRSAERQRWLEGLLNGGGARPKRTRRTTPKCQNPDCGHAASTHNELGYCQARRPSASYLRRTGMSREHADYCGCTGFEDEPRTQEVQST